MVGERGRGERKDGTWLYLEDLAHVVGVHGGRNIVCARATQSLRLARLLLLLACWLLVAGCCLWAACGLLVLLAAG